MAYTNTWNLAVPAGSIFRNQVDDAMRQIKRDLEERLLEIYESPFADDPVIVKPAIKGNVTGKKLLLHHAAFKASNFTPAGSEVFTVGAGVHTAAIPIPVGCTITEVEILADILGAPSIPVEVFREAFAATPTVTVISTFNMAGTGPTIYTTGAISYVVPDDHMLGIKITSGAAQRIYGARVTYDTPDSRNTR